jgi:hypothetical protein
MALAGAGLLYVPAPAVAAGRAGDVAATRAYLRASEAYAREASTEVGASAAAIEARANRIAGECPGALTYAPRDVAFEELGEEMSTTLFSAGVAPMSTLRLNFARATGRLSWSVPRLTWLVRGLAVEVSAWVGLAQPDACADIQAWHATAYAALPQSAASFLARTDAIESSGYVGSSEESRETVIGRLLKKYEGPGEMRMTKRIEQREHRTDMILGAAEEAAWATLKTGLGVPTL